MKGPTREDTPRVTSVLISHSFVAQFRKVRRAEAGDENTLVVVQPLG